jgi:hypothetical protein
MGRLRGYLRDSFLHWWGIVSIGSTAIGLIAAFYALTVRDVAPFIAVASVLLITFGLMFAPFFAYQRVSEVLA